jgi:hypothetical protein
MGGIPSMPSIPENEPVGDGNEAKKKQNRRGNLHRQRKYKLNKQNKS